MKKQLLIRIMIIALLIPYTNALFAQKHIDLQMSIATPANNEVIPFGDTAYIKIAIKNLGPDTLKMNQDTLYYGNSVFPFITSINWADIAPNDTAQFLVLKDYNTGEVTDNTESVCLYFLTDDYTSYVDTNQSNDTACITFILQGSQNNGIASWKNNFSMLGFQVYPNPAQGTTLISFMLEKPQKVTLSLQDLMGREVESRSALFASGRHGIQFNLSKLRPGMYFVCMEIAGEKRVKKLTIY